MRNRRNPKSRSSIPRHKRANSIPIDVCKTIYKMNIVDVRNKGNATHYKMTHSTISSIIQRYKKTKENTPIEKLWRKRNLTKRVIRLLWRYVMENCFKPPNIITCLFNTAAGLQISVSTVRRYIKKLNMSGRIAVQKPLQSQKHTAKCTVWGREHKNWTMTQWPRVMFTDRSSFSLRPMKTRLHVWCTKGTRLHQRHMVPTFKSGYRLFLFWWEFSKFGGTLLVGNIGSFNNDTYLPIVNGHMLPSMRGKHGVIKSFILQEDNYGPHRATYIATYQSNKVVVRLDWPDRVWTWIGKKIFGALWKHVFVSVICIHGQICTYFRPYVACEILYFNLYLTI